MNRLVLLLPLAVFAAQTSAAQSTFGADQLDVELVVDDLKYFFTESFEGFPGAFESRNEARAEGVGADIRYSTPWIEKGNWGLDITGSARLVDYDLELEYIITPEDDPDDIVDRGRIKDSFTTYGIFFGGTYHYDAQGFTPFVQGEIGYLSANSDFGDDSGFAWRSKLGIAIRVAELTLTPRYQISGVDSGDTRSSYGLEMSLLYNQGLILSGAFDRVEDGDFEGNAYSFKGSFLF